MKLPVLPDAFGPLFAAPAVFKNNIVWQNRSFYVTAAPCGLEVLLKDEANCNGDPVPDASGPYWDLGVLGAVGDLICMDCILTDADPSPLFVAEYFNGGPLATPTSDRFELGIALDEGGNFLAITFGPRTLWEVADGMTLNGDYPPRGQRLAIGHAVIADQVIAVLNATYGASLPRLSSAEFLDVLLADPFWDKDGDGRAVGRPFAGLLETIAFVTALTGDPDDLAGRQRPHRGRLRGQWLRTSTWSF